MSDWPAIFYSPHQDDEAIGMAGAIRQHKDAGRPVYLVLLTNGINSDQLDLMNGNLYCDWHKTTHRFDLSMEQFMWARKVEFIASAKSLGVDRVYIPEDGQGLDDREPYQDYYNFVSRVAETITKFERLFPGASHKLISGARDTWPDGAENPTHKACWDAAIALRDVISDFRFYRVYAYSHPYDERSGDEILHLNDEWRSIKQNALLQYKLFNPEYGRFAIGYHNVQSLIDAAYNDDREFMDLLP